ncbi:hypothetical protein FKM82_018403 [Ascaphus truei]
MCLPAVTSLHRASHSTCNCTFTPHAEKFSHALHCKVMQAVVALRRLNRCSHTTVPASISGSYSKHLSLLLGTRSSTQTPRLSE